MGFVRSTGDHRPELPVRVGQRHRHAADRVRPTRAGSATDFGDDIGSVVQGVVDGVVPGRQFKRRRAAAGLREGRHARPSRASRRHSHDDQHAVRHRRAGAFAGAAAVDLRQGRGGRSAWPTRARSRRSSGVDKELAVRSRSGSARAPTAKATVCRTAGVVASLATTAWKVCRSASSASASSGQRLRRQCARTARHRATSSLTSSSGSRAAAEQRSLAFGGYHRLNSANDWGDAFGLGGSLSALLFGRDEGYYYRSSGAELTGRERRALRRASRGASSPSGSTTRRPRRRSRCRTRSAERSSSLTSKRSRPRRAARPLAAAGSARPRPARVPNLRGSARAKQRRARSTTRVAAMDVNASRYLFSDVGLSLTGGAGTSGGTLVAATRVAPGRNEHGARFSSRGRCGATRTGSRAQSSAFGRLGAATAGVLRCGLGRATNGVEQVAG